MRLVLVHGINQQSKNPDGLRVEWLKGLRELAQAADWPEPTEIFMPFYGQDLYDLTEGFTKAEQEVVAQGGKPSAEAMTMARKYAEELKDRAGVSEAQIAEAEAEIAAEDGAQEIVVEQGSIVHNRRVKAIIRALEKISPFRGSVALRLLGQAHAYLTRGNVTETVDSIVKPALEGGEEMIIVAHSLGTIVTYKLLRDMAKEGTPANVRLYLTLGSPLGIQAVKDAIHPPFERPAGVKQWINGADPDDFVALDTTLRGVYGPHVQDLSDIRNGDEDKHSIVDYLANKSVYTPLLDATK